MTSKSVLLLFLLVLQETSCIEDFEHIGCFKDNSARVMPKLGNYRSLPESQRIQKCASTAKKKGYIVFGVQYGGHCFSGPNADQTYNKLGPATNCAKGLGGSWSNDVYKFKVCRQVMLKERSIEKDHILSKHSIAQHLVHSESVCRIKCYINQDCVSYNLGPSTPGMLLCELNNADRSQYPQDLEGKPGFKYVGAEIITK